MDLYHQKKKKAYGHIVKEFYTEFPFTCMCVSCTNALKEDCFVTKKKARTCDLRCLIRWVRFHV